MPPSCSVTRGEPRQGTERPATTQTTVGPVDAARRLLDERARLLVMGEAGVGKQHVALDAAAQRPGHIEVLDVALTEVEGPSRWAKRVQRRLSPATGTVVTRHIDAVPAERKDRLVTPSPPVRARGRCS